MQKDDQAVLQKQALLSKVDEEGQVKQEVNEELVQVEHEKWHKDILRRIIMIMIIMECRS